MKIGPPLPTRFYNILRLRRMPLQVICKIHFDPLPYDTHQNTSSIKKHHRGALVNMAGGGQSECASLQASLAAPAGHPR